MNGKIPKPAEYIKAFEQMGFGMFVHMGLYSALSSGEWTYSIHKRDMADYATLAQGFDVKKGAMEKIVAIAKNAGCKYITMTTRHHEGFSLYDTRGLSTFDVIHSPTARDLIAEFVEECRKADIKPFFYHTTLDWYEKSFNEDFSAYLEYLRKSVQILCTEYGEIGGFWFDGDWSRPEADWNTDALYGMIRRLQPNAMIINNTGLSHRGELGADEIDSVTYERGMPAPIDRRGMKKYVAGEMCETLCDHWGVAVDINFKPVKQLIEELCDCRKVGANFLLNIGPNGDGTVSKMQEATMECIGRWMSFFGKAIYNGRPYLYYDNTKDFVLRDAEDEKTLYLFKFEVGKKSGDTNVTIDFGGDGVTKLTGFLGEVESVNWMDNGESLRFAKDGDTLSVICTGYDYGVSLCVRVAEIKLK